MNAQSFGYSECGCCGVACRLIWFGHLDCKSVDDWVLVCRKMDVARTNVEAGAGRLGEDV